MRLFIFLLFTISSSIAQNTVRDKLSIKYNIERGLINGAILDSLSSIYPSDFVFCTFYASDAVTRVYLGGHRIFNYKSD